MEIKTLRNEMDGDLNNFRSVKARSRMNEKPTKDGNLEDLFDSESDSDEQSRHPDGNRNSKNRKEDLKILEQELKTIKEKMMEAQRQHILEIQKVTENSYQNIQSLQDEMDYKNSQLQQDIQRKNTAINDLKQELVASLHQLKKR